jgi:endo-1,4-beta-D-glucanase Y
MGSLKMNQRLFVYIFCVFLTSAMALNYPFPQKKVYDNMRTPEGDRDAHAQTIGEYYTQWKDAYVRSYSFTNGALQERGTGYVLKAETNPSELEGFGETISQSEAHGWAMIITVLMAGWDPDAREIFDGLYRVYQNWSCNEHSELMSWAVPRDGDFSPSRRQPSATDGDMDAAYALLLAADQWDDTTYYRGALRIIAALEENNILYAPKHHPTAEFFPRLGIGTNDNYPEQNYWNVRATRSSDFMVSHFDVFHAARKHDDFYMNTGAGDVPRVWEVLTEKTFDIVAHMQHPVTGLIPDFMGNKDGDFTQPISSFSGISDEPYENPGSNDSAYWYNACRFPWRFAQGYIHSDMAAVKPVIARMEEWLLGAEVHYEWGWFQDTLLRAGYTVDGAVLPGYDYYDRAFAAPFMTALSIGEEEWHFNAMWETISWFREPGDWSRYYDNTISLLNMLLVSGNWWKPSPETFVSIIPVDKKEFGTLNARCENSVLRLYNAEPKQAFSLFTPRGQLVLRDHTDTNGIALLPSLPAGIYLVYTDRGICSVRVSAH